MDLFDFLISKIAPHECLACGAEGQLLCANCSAGLAAVPERCYRCHRLSAGGLTCCPGSRLGCVRVGTVYDGSAKALIWKLKLAGARSAASIMAQRLTPLITDETTALIVPVPTATSRARQRGYDQAKLLARELARQTGLPYRDCLARRGQSHQHGLSRQDRLSQLAGAFYIRRPAAIRGAHILLVDDVVTTGASLEAAATVLHAAGAARLEAAVFAQPVARLI